MSILGKKSNVTIVTCYFTQDGGWKSIWEIIQKKAKEIVTTSIPTNIVHMKSLVVNLATYTQMNASMEIDVKNTCVNLDTYKEQNESTYMTKM